MFSINVSLLVHHILLVSVLQKVNSAIYWIVIFSVSLVSLLLCVFVAIGKITIRWTALSTFLTTGPVCAIVQNDKFHE